jgi:hypothetical protein
MVFYTYRYVILPQLQTSFQWIKLDSEYDIQAFTFSHYAGLW